jgi:hypothetical protein
MWGHLPSGGAYHTQLYLLHTFVWMANKQLARLAYSDGATLPTSPSDEVEPNKKPTRTSRMIRYLKEHPLSAQGFPPLGKMHSMMTRVAKTGDLQAPPPYRQSESLIPKMADLETRRAVVNFIQHYQAKLFDHPELLTELQKEAVKNEHT